MASTDPRSEPSAVLRAAAEGILPAWSRVTEPRRAHIERVASLMDRWARALGLADEERRRWRAAAWLHDALRDASPDELRPRVPAELADLPDSLLHGPAAAQLLGDAADPAIRTAVRYHTVGHPSLDRMGRALYLADFLEPGRDFLVAWRAELRERMPHEMDAVLVETVATRVRHLLEARVPIRPETAAFWSALPGVGR